MELLTPREISASFDKATFSRGESYYREKRVADLSVEVIDDDFVILRSNVRGSGYVYTVEVSIEVTGAYHTDIVGDCSCPVGYNCKHAVATCLTYLTFKPDAADRDSSKQADSAASIWLGNLVSANQSTRQEDNSPVEFLAYLLDESSQPGQLSVRVVECKLGKNGRPTKVAVSIQTCDIFLIIWRQMRTSGSLHYWGQVNTHSVVVLCPISLVGSWDQSVFGP